MGVKYKNIELYFGPKDLGAPDDLEKVIIEFIDKAKISLAIAVQEIESLSIAKAIVNAKMRKVQIHIVVEQDYLRSKKPSKDPFIPDPNESLHENREIFAALLRAGIDIRTDYNPHIFHQKFIIRDFTTNNCAVLTGSTNFTPTGVGTHENKKNLNHVVIINSKNTATDYNNEFEEIWDGTFGLKQKRHDNKPRTIKVSGINTRAIFAPDHTPELEIMKYILKAKKRIDFAIFTFSNSSGIDDALLAIASPTVKIKGIFDATQGNQKWAATYILKDKNIETYLAKKGEKLGKLHHKLMVIDDSIIICGSFNYTDPANRLNDENIIIIGDPYEKDIEIKKAQEILAVETRKEIERIITVNGEKIK